MDKIELIFHFRAYRSPLDFVANALESPWQLPGNVLMLPLELIWSSFRSIKVPSAFRSSLVVFDSFLGAP